MNISIKSPDECDNKVSKFLDLVIDKTKSNRSLNTVFLLVIHYVPTFPYILDALSKINARIPLLVPKSSYHNEQSVRDISSKGYRILGFNREDNFDDPEFQNFYQSSGIFNCRKYLQTKGKLINLIEKTIKPDENFIFIDIGGYFSYFLDDLKSKYPERFIGVVEGTENGYQKYENALKDSEILRNFPIMSMARSALKKTEDYNVGKSIVEAASSILRTDCHGIIERMNVIGVIGFGVIGRSTAEHLRQKYVRRVIVLERDPIRIMEAVSLGFEVAREEKWLLNHADMIFSATGSQCLNEINARELKNNVFIASCTSNDDEFSGNFRSSLTKVFESEHIETFQSIDNKLINLLHKGNAVNFIFNATNGPFIYSVLVSLIVSAIKISLKDVEFNCIEEDTFRIKELDRTCVEEIARIWLDVFEFYE